MVELNWVVSIIQLNSTLTHCPETPITPDDITYLPLTSFYIVIVCPPTLSSNNSLSTLYSLSNTLALNLDKYRRAVSKHNQKSKLQNLRGCKKSSWHGIQHSRWWGCRRNFLWQPTSRGSNGVSEKGDSGTL